MPTSAATAMTSVTSPSGARTTKMALDGQRGDDVLAHHAGGLTRAAEGLGQPGEVVGHERDVGGLKPRFAR
jgi:hypothetical protein